MPIKSLWIKSYEVWGQEDFKFLDFSTSSFLWFWLWLMTEESELFTLHEAFCYAV